MKIPLRELAAGRTRFQGEISTDIYALDDPDAVPEGGYQYAVEAGQQGASVWVTGRLEAAFTLRCVRCMEPFRFPVVIEDFAAQRDVENQEILDLTEEVREVILLALPAHPVCDWSGNMRQGHVCPGRAIVHALAPTTGPTAGPSAPATNWDALDQLKELKQSKESKESKESKAFQRTGQPQPDKPNPTKTD